MSDRIRRGRPKIAAVEVAQAIGRRILAVRGERVMLDADLAEIYGVEAKRLNEAVRRNRGRFPEDFMFQLTDEEFRALRSQFATSNAASRGGRRYRPHVFTEQGVAMLSSVLNSERAIAVNILIMRAFVQLRRAQVQYAELWERIEEMAQTVQGHEDLLSSILDVLKALEQPASTAARPIGFRRRPSHDAPSTRRFRFT